MKKVFAELLCEKTRQKQKCTKQKMMEKFVILLCKQYSEYIHIVCVKKKTKENNRKIQLMGTPHSLSRKI